MCADYSPDYGNGGGYSLHKKHKALFYQQFFAYLEELDYWK
jgi:hypothetical protein